MQIEIELARLDAEIEAAYQRQSVLARLGRGIEPVVRPLGWDWRIGSAVLASFPQREAVIATLGVIFSDGTNSGEQDDASLADRLRSATWDGTDRPLFTIPTALSIMVFYAICAMRGDFGGHPPRDGQLALADRDLRVPDRAGLPRFAADLPGGHVVGWLKFTRKAALLIPSLLHNCYYLEKLFTISSNAANSLGEPSMPRSRVTLRLSFEDASNVTSTFLCGNTYIA